MSENYIHPYLDAILMPLEVILHPQWEDRRISQRCNSANDHCLVFKYLSVMVSPVVVIVCCEALQGGDSVVSKVTHGC